MIASGLGLPVVTPDLRVGFILAPRFSLLPFAGFIDSLRHAADEGENSRQIYCTWRVVAATPSPVTASCGLQVTPEAAFPPPEAFDYLAVVGGLLPDCLAVDDATLGYLRAAHAAGVALIGLCTGSFILGKAGLLSGRRCAVHAAHRAQFEALFPDTVADSERPHVSDANTITCPGGVSALDLAFSIIKTHCGRARSDRGLQTRMMTRRDVTEGAAHKPCLRLATCGDPRVERAIRLMEHDIARPCSIATLARRLGCPERELARAFTQAGAEGPASIWRRIRLERCRSQLLDTAKTVTQIACDDGFAGTAHFSRWFKRVYGESPMLYRKRRRQPAPRPDLAASAQAIAP